MGISRDIALLYSGGYAANMGMVLASGYDKQCANWKMDEHGPFTMWGIRSF